MTLISFIFVLVTLGTLPYLKEDLKIYSVFRISGDISLSGKGDSPYWMKASLLTDFSYPWEKERPPVTKFRALHNDDWLYCLYDVTDHNVNILQEKNEKWEVASSSRVEIFFKIDDALTPYYCLEIDPLGRVLDYEATFHRKFNPTWSWPVGQLIVKTERRKDGYSLELAISKASLKNLGLVNNNSLKAGLYRGDCTPQSSGDPDFKWISWATPDSKTPDFHIPSSFGILRLEE